MQATTPPERNFFILTMVKNGYSGTQIHHWLTTAWGDCISLRRVQELCQEFRSGERASSSRIEGSGRPSSSSTEDNIERVKVLVEENPRLRCAAIEGITDIPKSSVRRILVEKLKKKSLHAKWIPHILNDGNKAARVAQAREIGKALRTRRISRRLIVVDEKWIFHRYLPPMQNNRSWVDGSGDREKVARRAISDRKTMVIWASNFEGDMYVEVIDHGSSVNAVRYIAFWERLLQHFSSLTPPLSSENIIAMHDNARPHVAAPVQEWLTSKNITRIAQPPYSPDFNLLDRFVFRNFETFRAHHEFASDDDVLHWCHLFREQSSRSEMIQEMGKFANHLDEVKDIHGDYV